MSRSAHISEARAWYALRVRARSEPQVASCLTQKDLECFLPSWEERRVYSDRLRRVTRAAFPGYLFCRTDLSQRVRVLSTPGVQTLVSGPGGSPAAIEDEVIWSLQRAFSRSERASSFPYLQSGDVVRILDGPMTGATGVLVRSKGSDRLVISVSILRRSVAVEVDGASVARVGASREIESVNLVDGGGERR